MIAVDQLTAPAIDPIARDAAAGILGRAMCAEHLIAPISFQDDVLRLAHINSTLDPKLQAAIGRRISGCPIRVVQQERTEIDAGIVAGFGTSAFETAQHIRPEIEEALRIALDECAEDIILQPSPLGNKHHGGDILIMRGGQRRVIRRLTLNDYENIRMTLAQRAFPIDHPSVKQRGHFHGIVDGRPFFCRALGVPADTMDNRNTNHIQLRVLRPYYLIPPLSRFGFSEEQLAMVLMATSRAGTNTIIAAPPGNGKTTLAYRLLMLLAQTDGNIFTLENPREVFLPGITQMRLREGKDGFSLEDGIEETLGLSPAMVFIGESLSEDATKHAIRAMSSGIPTMTSYHAEDAASIPYRLVRHGIPAEAAAHVNLLVATRLIPVLCPGCKQPDTSPSPAMRKLLSSFPAFAQGAPFRRVRASGKDVCPDCLGAGISGRTGIGEAYALDSDATNAIRYEQWDRLREILENSGMGTLMESALTAYAHGRLSEHDFLRCIPAQRFLLEPDSATTEAAA